MEKEKGIRKSNGKPKRRGMSEGVGKNVKGIVHWLFIFNLLPVVG